MARPILLIREVELWQGENSDVVNATSVVAPRRVSFAETKLIVLITRKPIAFTLS